MGFHDLNKTILVQLFVDRLHGGRSHLFSHVAGCVVFWCEMFALNGWFV